MRRHAGLVQVRVVVELLDVGGQPAMLTDDLSNALDHEPRPP